MEKPTLEQVKKHFENAKEVRCLNGRKDIGTPDFEQMHFTDSGSVIQNPYSKNWLVLYCPKKGYAEIISYKDETFTITKEFILDLHNEVIWPSVKAKIEKEFPSVFEVKATEMTVAEIEQKLGYQIKIVK
jgi:hypothetical protein